ncbi:MAG: hypothetical protein U9Q40_03860 [Campylobacterota bacterium]|nr:hypothetical protein [Campylobacterota bacterium]
MNLAAQISEEAKRLPEPLAREVLDFIGYIAAKHKLNTADIEPLKQAQIPTMQSIWDNSEDEAWNEL